MKARFFRSVLLLWVSLAISPGLAAAQSKEIYPQSYDEAAKGSEMEGMMDFVRTCAKCHGRIAQAPALAVLQSLPPEAIYQAMTSGPMKPQAAALSDTQKTKIAEWLSGRRLIAGANAEVANMPNKCAAGAMHRPDAATWNGWSPNPLTNTRFQPGAAAGLSPAAVGRLELKWAFGLPGTTSAYGQPTVANGMLYIGSDSGYFYALDAQSGCVHWSFHAQAGLRSAPTTASGQGANATVYIGDVRGHVYALEASTGRLLWKITVDPDPLTRITGALSVYEGRLYVPVANLEEDSPSDYSYKCCTSRGKVVALNAATGEQIWKTYTIAEPATPRKTRNGIAFLGPSGASVWGPLTIDPKRRALYFGTGNQFSEPDVGRSDAVIALNMDTGAILWINQVERGDIWAGWCESRPAPPGFPPRSAALRRGEPVQPLALPAPPPGYYCADVPNNPDYDFSAGQMLIDRGDGHSLLVAGQKSGLVWAFDPDNGGAVVWKSDISRGEITFGGASDGTQAYFGMRGGALTAIRLGDGLELWSVPIDPQPSMKTHRGVSAAISVIPGVIFVPCLDGTLRAYSTFDGRPIWQYDTTPKIATINSVEAHGGSIGSAGAIVVDGMVYVTSGYIGYQGGQPGNLLLAFAPPTQ